MLKQIDGDLPALLGGDGGYCFLVGAGISIDPPSGLASARQLMDGIIKFSAPPKAIEEICQIPNLRYETLVEEYRAAIDHDLVFIKYFDELSLTPDRQPNSIHRYLAKMLAAGNPVLTTNFDHFIERAVGLDNPRLVDIITSKDFDAHADPQVDQAKNMIVLYKLHGSNENPLTGEDTKSTVITTLSALGKGKEGDVFSVEVFKRPLFDKICDGRKLVVMGYSGGDDFDVVPMLARMKGVQSVIWISHGSASKIETFKVLPDTSQILVTDSRQDSTTTSQDRMLTMIAQQLGVEVIKVVGPTAEVIAALQRVDARDVNTRDAQVTAIDTWLASKLPSPSIGDRECFAGQILVQNGLQDKALAHFKASLSYYEKQGDKRNIAILLSLIGAQLPARDAIPYYTRALSIFEELGDRKGIASQLVTTSVTYLAAGEIHRARDGLLRAIQVFESERFSNGLDIAYSHLGDVWNMLGELGKAVECHEKAYQVAQLTGELVGIANALESKAQFHIDVGEGTAALKVFQQAIDIHEKLHNKQHVSRLLRQMGDIHKTTGDLNQASIYYQRALETSNAIGDIHSSGVVRASIAALLAAKGDYEEALSEYDRAQAIFEQLGDLHMIATTISDRSELLLAKGDIDAAIERLSQAREMLEKLGDKVDLPNVHSVMGTTLDAKGEYRRALEHHERALQMHQDLDVRVAVAHDLSNLGLVHLHLKNHEKSLSHYKQALAIFQDSHDQAGVARQFHGIAQVHEHLDNLFLARYYYKLALERELATRNTRALMFRRIDLATMSMKLGMVNEAIDNVGVASLNAEEIGDHERKQTLDGQFHSLGSWNAGQYVDDLIRKYETAKKQKDKTEIRRTILLLGLHHMDRDIPMDSVKFFSEALQAFAHSEEDEVIAGIYQYLGDIQGRLDKNSDALKAYENAARIQEKLGNREQLGYLLAMIGYINLLLDKKDLAMSHWTRSLDLLQAIGEYYYANAVLNFMGDAHLQSKRYQESLDSYQKAIKYVEKIGNLQRKGELLYCASRVFIDKGDLPTAILYLTESIEISSKCGNKELGENATKELASLKQRQQK